MSSKFTQSIFRFSLYLVQCSWLKFSANDLAFQLKRKTRQNCNKSLFRSESNRKRIFAHISISVLMKTFNEQALRYFSIESISNDAISLHIVLVECVHSNSFANGIVCDKFRIDMVFRRYEFVCVDSNCF